LILDSISLVDRPSALIWVNAASMALAGAGAPAELHEKLQIRGITSTIANARGQVHDVLRADGLDTGIGSVAGGATLADARA
jgi:hypothetical protein